MARFQDIPKFVRSANYVVNVGLNYLPSFLYMQVEEMGLDTSPDFQRAHVWNEGQKVRFMEYMLRGGLSGMDIYTNCPVWHHGFRIGPEHPEAWYVLVDGKQRLDAALGFLNNEFPVFGGNYYRDYTDAPSITLCTFRWHVNDLQTREECLQWYLDLNSGGTIHSEEELDRVRTLLASKVEYDRPTLDGLRENARLDRAIFTAIAEKEAAAKVKRAEDAARAQQETVRPKKLSKRRK